MTIKHTRCAWGGVVEVRQCRCGDVDAGAVPPGQQERTADVVRVAVGGGYRCTATRASTTRSIRSTSSGGHCSSGAQPDWCDGPLVHQRNAIGCPSRIIRREPLEYTSTRPALTREALALPVPDPCCQMTTTRSSSSSPEKSSALRLYRSR